MRLGLGLGHQRGSSVLHAFDFTSATIASGVFSLPSWLAITCATTLRTVQTSASTLLTGLGANAARARNTGSGWGLALESARTNGSIGSDAWTSAEWSAGSMTRAGSQSDPAGGTSAVRFTSAGGDFSDYDGVPGNYQTLSTWAKLVSGAAPHFRFSAAYVDPSSSSWARISASEASNTNAVMNLEARDIPAGAGAKAASVTHVFGCQLEASCLYPSSYIPTTVAARARAADVLSIGTPAGVAPGGYFDLRCTVAPNYSQAEQGADHDIFFLDASNRLFLRASDHKLVLRLAGANAAVSSALTWSREQALTIRAHHGTGGQSLTVSGATSGSGTATASAAAAISLPATAYLGGNASGPQECLDLRTMAFVRP